MAPADIPELGQINVENRIVSRGNPILLPHVELIAAWGRAGKGIVKGYVQPYSQLAVSNVRREAQFLISSLGQVALFGKSSGAYADTKNQFKGIVRLWLISKEGKRGKKNQQQQVNYFYSINHKCLLDAIHLNI